MTVDGIDIANYQASNYGTAGLAFVFVKATEGTSYVNPKHDAQVAHGRAAGLVAGHYHFVRPGSMTEQAAYFLAHARPRAGDVLCLDWEDRGVSGAQKDEFLRAVKAARPANRLVLYANRDFWLHLDHTSFAADGLFIADPSAPKGHPRVEHPWLFHQYSSAGGLDRDTANFADRAALQRWAAGTTPEEDDPMAGMTADDIYNAVWRRDRMEPPTGLATKDNPKWLAENTLRDINARVRAIEAKEAAQSAAIAALARLAGANVDTATVVAAVRDAIATATVHVAVDVTGAEPTADAPAAS